MSGKPKVPYADLVAAYRELGSAKAAASRFGVSDQSIYTALKALGEASNPPSRRKVSDEEIIEAYRRLGDGNKVAKQLRTNAVYDVLRKHGISADGHKKYVERVRKIGPEEIGKIAAEYADGLSASEIARNFHCTIETILKALRRSGVVIRSTKPHMTAEEKEDVKKLYEGGMNFVEVAAATGRHVNTVLHLINNEYPDLSRSDAIGPGSPHFRGGMFTDSQGYKQEWIGSDDPFFSMARKAPRDGAKSSYVPQHRIVMARALGRPLLDTETVHHIDGDRQNNDPSNLQLRQGKHGKHVVMCCLDCGSRNIGHAAI